MAAMRTQLKRNFIFQLADRMLEFVGAIDADNEDQRVLDKLKVEKDRGITVKAQTCSLVYRCAKDGKDYLLNLIDVSYFYAIMVCFSNSDTTFTLFLF